MRWSVSIFFISLFKIIFLGLCKINVKLLLLSLVANYKNYSQLHNYVNLLLLLWHLGYLTFDTVLLVIQDDSIIISLILREDREKEV